MNRLRRSYCLRHAWRRAPAWLAVVLAVGCVREDTQDLQEFIAATKNTALGVKLEPPPEIKPYQPFTYNAQGFKDPFVLSSFAQQQVIVEQPEIVDTGVRPDPDRAREELEKYTLATLKMMGVLRAREGEYWALVKAPDGIIYRVRKGNYLGTDQGKIISISEQRIELTEIIAEGNRWTERNAFLAVE